jgi:hypothetical protein
MVYTLVAGRSKERRTPGHELYFADELEGINSFPS